MTTHTTTPVAAYIFGSYNSLGALVTAHPDADPGATALVTGQVYVWNGSQWVHAGAASIQRAPVTEQRTGVHLRTLQRWEAKGFFPRRIVIGPNSVGHYAHEVDAWMARRARQQDLPRQPPVPRSRDAADSPPAA